MTNASAVRNPATAPAGAARDAEAEAALVRSSLFGSHRSAELEAVMRYAVPVTLAAHEVLYREGDDVRCVHVVVSGVVKLLSYLPNGRARIVRLHARGSVLGLIGLQERAYEHTAVCVEDLRAYRIPVHLLAGLREREPQLYVELLSHWHQYLGEADTWIVEFSTGSIRARVARLIQYLSALQGVTDAGGGTDERGVTLLTSEEMAEVLGVTPESVSRVVAELKRRKVLEPAGDDDPARRLQIGRPGELDAETLD